MAKLPIRIREVLGAVAAGELAWRKVGEVALAIGFGYDATTDLLGQLERDGLVASWSIEWQKEVWVTLSPLSAELLGLVVVEDGPAELPRWIEGTVEQLYCGSGDPPLDAPAIRQPRDLEGLGRRPRTDLFAACGLIKPPPVMPPRRPSSKKRKRKHRGSKVGKP